MPTSTARDSWAQFLAGAACAALIAVLTAGSILPALTIKSLSMSTIDGALPTIPILESTNDGGLRFPIVQSGGIIEKTFPDGVPVGAQGGELKENAKVLGMVRQIALNAGVGDRIEELLTTADYTYRFTNAEPSYPYIYPRLDALTESITADAVREHGSQLVELSSALLFAERPPAAYSLLRRMASVENSCPVQLNLAAAVALGFRPRVEHVEEEFRKAKELCTDLPLAFAAYAKVRLAYDTRQWGFGDSAGYHIGHVGEEAAALQAAHETERRFPTHPLGYVTEATILLEVADKYHRVGHHPFSVRAMYERSLALLDAVALVQRDDPSVSFGRARALAGLGRNEEASAITAVLISRFHDTREIRYGRDSLRSMYLDQGRVSEAVDTMVSPSGSTDPFSYDAGPFGYMGDGTCYSLFPFGDNSFRGTVGDPEPGWQGNCYVAFLDATGGWYPGGADTLDYIDYIPRYRVESVARDFLLVIANRASELPAGLGWGRDLSLMEQGRWSEVRPSRLTRSVEAAQDALRRCGQLDRAEQLLRSALDAGVGDRVHLMDRLGEVLFLKGQYDQARESFAVAAAGPGLDMRHAGEGIPWGAFAVDAIGPAWSTIKLATASYRMGSADAAMVQLRDLDTAAAEVGPLESKWGHAALEVARDSLMGTILLKSGRYSEAVEPLHSAVSACDPWRGKDTDLCSSGVQFNNLAVALLRSGRPGEAVPLAKEAIARDPNSAMFVEALANSFEEAGEIGSAIDVYRDAIEIDQAQVTAHNNLGVLLAQGGKLEEAQQHFLAAVAARPDYAGAWFNQGLAFQSSVTFWDFQRSQGALARAAQLSPAFRGVDLEWYSDRQVYNPDLDLSKPLPKDWSAGTKRQAIPLGLPALVLAVGTLIARQLVEDRLQGNLVEAGLERLTGRFILLKRIFGSHFAGIVLAGVIAYSYATSLGGAGWHVGTGVLIGLLIALWFMSSRRSIDCNARHRVSLPGVVVGLLGCVANVPFVPVPVLAGNARFGTRWIPYLGLAGAACIAGALAWWSEVPLVRIGFEMLVLTVASGLVSIAPLDGAFLGRRASRVAAIVLGLIAILMAIQWV
jgi:tetratricopeptide (TPR) repeat protein